MFQRSSPNDYPDQKKRCSDERKTTIDLWKSAIIYKQSSGIYISGSKAVITVNTVEYSIESESIEEINIYKNDHMSFDTLILQIILPDYVIEIPYEIEFEEYQKRASDYVIPEYQLSPVINGFTDLIQWLYGSLKDFKSDWLDETKPILDTTNFMNAYKRILPENEL